MNSILHHIDRLMSGQAMADASRMTQEARKELVEKVGLVAAGVFLGALIAGAALCAVSKLAGTTLMLASPLLGIAAGAYAFSFFTERYPINRVVNLLQQVTQVFVPR